MKKQTVWIVGGFVALLGVVGFFVIDLMKNKPSNDATTGNTDEAPSSTGITYTTSEPSGSPSDAMSTLMGASFPLKVGSKGIEVKELQQWLNENSYFYPADLLVTDGIFGNRTKAAVQNMQGSANNTAVQNFNTTGMFSGSENLGEVSKAFYTRFIK